jgi:uncharacterized repeat protein (TIGR03806 family)
MRAPLVLLLSVVACSRTPEDDSYDRRDDTGSVPVDDSGTDTDDSATADDSTPPDDSGTPPVYGLDERPTNATCLAPARPASDFDAVWEAVFPALAFDYAVQITHPPGDDSWFYVVQQDGKVFAFENRDDVKETVLVLDKSGEVAFDYAELGLLSIAFHPDFAINGAVFLSYDINDGGLKNRVTRVTTTGIGERFDDSAEQEVFDIDDPASNHNGGQLGFGPDGYLYFSTGDGGGGGDTYDNGQNPDTLLAKILRVDVDGGDPYAIPGDNPWADGADGVPEMYAWGFRNPWRFHFDPATGDLWVGDVGQNKWEEIDLVQIGGNYGWPIWEGAHCYGAATCDDLGFLNPMLEYDPGSSASVIMGPVYRGSALPSLVGTPLFTDFYTPDLQGVFFDEATSAPEMREVAAAFGAAFAGLGTDEAGEVYAVDYYSGGGVYELVPAGGTKKEDPFPDLLSETGCVDPKDPTIPAAGLVPYAPNAAFWSDGADKVRWFAIPDGTTIAIEKNGDFTFPIGTVTMKQFSLAGSLVETRLFVLHEDGHWAGYSYAWNGADAAWVRGGSVAEVAGQEWTFPSAAMCLACHTQAAGGTLGPELGQLNGDFSYPSTGRVANQLRTLDHIGILDLGGAEPDTLDLIPDPFGSEDLHKRARAWLHTNCSFCHQPGGLGGGDADLRFSTPGTAMQICDVAPTSGDLGIEDALLLAPGEPDRSVLLSRISRRDAYAMPPLASSLVDDDGVALVREWIESMAACP